MKPLTHAERRAQGLQARKQLSRRSHAAVNAKAFPADPLAILADSMAGRVPELVPLKYERMAASPFGFLRGAVSIMAADLASQPDTGLVTQLCGDAHVANLGAYAGPDGNLVFDINDFDETIRGPFEWDVKRMATSLLLAGREARLHARDRRDAVQTFTSRYQHSIRIFAKMPVLELARYQIRRIARVDPMPAIFAQAERSTPQRLLAKLTEPRPGAGETGPAARRFRSDPPLLKPVEGAERSRVLDAIAPYAQTLQPERRHFLSQYTAVDVAFKVVGTGSVGLRNYLVYFEGRSRPSDTDPLFVEIKEEPASAYARYLPEGSGGETHQGLRVVNGQRALQLTSDPFLGYTTIENRDFLVRQLNDHRASLDIVSLTPASLHGYADLCGELLARGHARAGDPVALAAYMGSSARFGKAVLRFARVYADKTERDWRTVKRRLSFRAEQATL